MKLSGIFYAIGALMLGGVVLFVSLTKASLQIWAHEGNENRINKIPVEMKITTESGEVKECNYKLPVVNVLPNNICYGAKTIRDEMWMAMTTDKLTKAKITLLLADKKMSEFKNLVQINETKLLLKSGADAIKKLEYGYQIVMELKPTEETKKLKQKYIEAGIVYEQMFREKSSNNKVIEIINNIKNWNDSRKKEVQIKN